MTTMLSLSRGCSRTIVDTCTDYNILAVLSIQPGYRQLEYCREAYPYQVRDVGKCDPFDMRVDDKERPYKGGEDEQDIDKKQLEKIIKLAVKRKT